VLPDIMSLLSLRTKLAALLGVLMAALVALICYVQWRIMGHQDEILVLAAILIVAGLPLFLIGIAIISGMTGRLRRLIAVMESARGIDTLKPLPEFAIPVSHGDEIDQLGHAFNALVRRTNSQIEMVRTTDTARRDLFANVSHDLRTPLAALRGYVETLLLGGDAISARDTRMYLEVAMRQIEQLSRMVDELFDLARLDAPDAQLRRETFHPSELAQDVVQKFETLAAKANVRIEPELGETLPLVEGDVALLERVLSNILQNALQHTPGGGRIAVGTDLSGSDVRFTVRDSGSGIAAHDLPFIFDRFYKVDRSRNPQQGGSGLGLAIARRIIDLHHGNIRVESEIGCGTSFLVTLPISAAQGDLVPYETQH